jgi:hypothetical protein
MVFSLVNFQKFNLTTQIWTPIFTNPPNDALSRPACLVLPSEDILVVGGQNDLKQSLLYNPLSNTWKILPNTNTEQGYSRT